MNPKNLALFSFLTLLASGFAAAEAKFSPKTYGTKTNSCAIPNSPYPEYRDCPDCTEVCPDSGEDDNDSSGGGSGAPPLGSSPHSGSKPPAGSVETPNSVIGLNHGGALLNTTDLKVPGSLSGVPLRFTRYYNSRDAEGYGELMGHGRTWTHSFSWRMTLQGNTARVDFPSGRRLAFTQGSSTTYRGQSATVYNPPAGFGERLYKVGDFWHLDQVGAAAHTFERVVLPDSTVLYHPRESVDTRGNKLTYETNAAARITKATDALGNHIELAYSQITLNRKAAVNLHTVATAPSVGWNEVILTPGQPFRWLQGVSAPNFYFEVSEIEFYKDNGGGGYTKLGGAAYGTGPARDNSNRTFDKAFDGNTSTRFSFCRPNHGVAGLDLGSSGAATVTRIRYHIPSSFSGQLGKYVGMTFEGMTEQPETLTVLSAVTASTGQSIEFEYGEHLDESIGQSHAVLEKVIYRDAANSVTDEAVLSWVTSQQGTSPSIRRAIEPRSTSATPDISFDYYPGHLAVKGQPAFVLAGDPADERLIQVSNPKLTAQYTAPDGGVHSVVNTNTSAYRPSSTTDAGGKTTSYAWNSGGFISSQTDPAGATTYTRNTRGQILTMTRPDGLTVTHTYLATRLLSVKRSAAGFPDRLTTYTRDGNGRVTKTTFPDGSFEDYTYDTHGLLTSVREKNGSFTVHTYDTTPGSPTAGLRLTTTRGLPAAGSDPALGETTAYTWHLPGNTSGSPARLLASSTDPRGRTTAYEYDHAGRLAKTTYPDNSFRQIERDLFGNKTAEFDGTTITEWTHDFFRRVLTHTVDAAPGGLNLTTTYDYGLNGSSCNCYGSGGPTLITSPAGRKTRRTYDFMGRLLTETKGFTTADAATTAREYDTLGRMTKLIDPDLYETTYTHDPAGRVLTRTSDPGGLNLATEYDHSPFGDTLTVTAPGNRVTTTEYDKMSRPVSIKDALLRETVIGYDLAGNRTHVTEAAGDALERTTEFTYDAYNRLTLTEYEDGSTVSQTYHPGGAPHTTTDELGRKVSRDTVLTTGWPDSLGQSWTSFASVTVRDPDGLARTSVSYGPPMSFTGGTRKTVSAAGRISEAYSDAAGRTTLTRTGLVTSGSGLAADITDTVMEYDNDGFLLTSTVDPAGLNEQTTYTPDGLARIKAVTDPLRTTAHPAGRTTTYTYDKRGNRVKTKLHDNREHHATYDALSRTLTTTDPKNQTITYTYWNETGQQLTLKDAKNQTTAWDYFADGRLKSKAYPNGDDHAYTYDNLGRMKTHTTPKNETCTYTYDVRDRQTKRDWNSTTPDTVTDHYDDGRVKSIDNGSTLVEYAYDDLGQMTSETQTFTGRPARTVAYQYDADGLRDDLTYPSGKVIDHQWTAKGRLHIINSDIALNPPPPDLAEYTYDKAGRLDTLAHENGITEDLTFDAAGQLLSRLHKQGATTVSGHGYTLDATGRRTAETFPGPGSTTPARTYGYDDADQVTSANYDGGGTFEDTYAYDPAGNRTTATVAALGGTATTYTANSANQYTSITGMSAPVHDANGNLTSQNGNTYTWDSENRLLSVAPTTPAVGDKSLGYIYDALHRRVIRNIHEWNGSAWSHVESIRFIHDGWNVIAEYALTSTTETLTRELTWGTDLSGSLQGAGGVGGLLMVEEIGTTTTAYHFQYDGNGNVTEITDHTGSTAATYRYDAFGNTLVATGSYATTNRYRFSTKPLDNEVPNAPLYYYGYRYYDPVTGRWPSRDPIGENGGINLYGFVGNSPIHSIDKLGLWKEIERKGERWAKTCAEKNDTWASLASIVGLDAGEASRWVKGYDASGPVPGKDYEVPNVYVAYNSYISPPVANQIFDSPLMRFLQGIIKKDAEMHKNMGFKVIENYSSNSEKVWTGGWYEDGIYAMGFSGHGTASGYEVENVGGKDVIVNAGSVYPSYKLSYLTAMHCGSSDAGWEKHVVVSVFGVEGLIGIQADPPFMLVFPLPGGKCAKIPMSDPK